MATTTTEVEVLELENALRDAELKPDSDFFQTYLDDEMVMVTEGKCCKPKAMIVEAHKSGGEHKLTKVEMSEMQVVAHGDSAVVTCTGEYEGPKGTFQMKFMRVWTRKPEGWRIVSGVNY